MTTTAGKEKTRQSFYGLGATILLFALASQIGSKTELEADTPGNLTLLTFIFCTFSWVGGDELLCLT